LCKTANPLPAEPVGDFTVEACSGDPKWYSTVTRAYAGLSSFVDFNVIVGIPPRLTSRTTASEPVFSAMTLSPLWMVYDPQTIQSFPGPDYTRGSGHKIPDACWSVKMNTGAMRDSWPVRKESGPHSRDPSGEIESSERAQCRSIRLGEGRFLLPGGELSEGFSHWTKTGPDNKAR